MLPPQEAPKVATPVQISGAREHCSRIAQLQLASTALAIAVLYHTWYLGVVGVLVAVIGLGATHRSSLRLTNLYYYANIFMIIYGAIMLIIWMGEVFTAAWASPWVFVLLLLGFLVFALLQFLAYKAAQAASDFADQLEQHMHKEISTPTDLRATATVM